MSDEEITDTETVTLGGLTLCETRVYKWCKKGRDGKYHPFKPVIPREDREGWLPQPILPAKPEAEWNAVTSSGNLDDLLGGELAAVIPIRPQEDE